MPDKTDGTPGAEMIHVDVRELGAKALSAAGISPDDPQLRPVIEHLRTLLTVGGTVEMANGHAPQEPDMPLAYTLALAVFGQDLRDWAADSKTEGFVLAANPRPQLLSFLRNVKVDRRRRSDTEWLETAVETAGKSPVAKRLLAEIRAQLAAEDADVTRPQVFPDVAPYFPMGPADTARVRRELAAWLASSKGYDHYADAVKQRRQQIFTRQMTYSPDPARLLQQAEHATIANAPLYYVDANSCEHAAAVLPSMPRFVPMRKDLPTKTGFVLFAKPLGDYMGQLFPGQEGALLLERDGELVDLSRQLRETRCQVIGASWRLSYDSWRQRERFTGGCFWITFYVLPPSRVLSRPGEPLRDVWALEAQLYTSVAPDQEGVVGLYDPTVMEGAASDYLDEMPDQPGPAQWIRALFGVFLLNAQKGIGARQVVRTQARKLSKSKARATGQKQIPAEEVQVLTLRGNQRRAPVAQPGDGAEGERPSRKYDRWRWPVREFWREQWYPSLNAHRPVLIAEYIKGPEGAPLKPRRDVVRVVKGPGKKE